LLRRDLVSIQPNVGLFGKDCLSWKAARRASLAHREAERRVSIRGWVVGQTKFQERQISGTLVMADQLATDIIDKIKAHAEPDGNEITVGTELGDLGIHSLELTEIVFDLEEAYGIEIEMNTVEAWNKLKNVGDIVEATRALIAAKG
jgi:nodulation protein F